MNFVRKETNSFKVNFEWSLPEIHGILLKIVDVLKSYYYYGTFNRRKNAENKIERTKDGKKFPMQEGVNMGRQHLSIFHGNNFIVCVCECVCMLIIYLCLLLWK